MKDKGQALVEFILIVPIILLIFVAIVDIGNIFLEKYNLNNDLEVVTDLYKNNNEKELKAYVASENIKYEIAKNNDMVKITVKKDIKISAPGLSNVLGKTYTAETSKSIYKKDSQNEQ